MEITLTKKEAEEYFYNAICNGLNYVLGYGLRLSYNENEYLKAKQSLKEYQEVQESLKAQTKQICYEDIYMEMLRMGFELTFIDQEGGGSMTRSVTLNDIHEKVAKSPAWALVQMSDETDDASTADAIIQTVFYGEIIFA